jgi:hypothetical protein
MPSGHVMYNNKSSKIWRGKSSNGWFLLSVPLWLQSDGGRGWSHKMVLGSVG